MANRFFVNGGVNNNWGTTGNWSLTSGGAGGQTVPTSADAVFFDANSPNCTVDTLNRVAATLTTTGYTNTLTLTFRITVSGAVTLGVGTQWAGSEYLAPTTTATHTANGNTVRNLWWQGLGATHTLADNWAALNMRIGTTNLTPILNGNQVSVSGDLDFGQVTTGAISGTTNLIMTGTGNLIPMTSTGSLKNNLTFNSGGTITGSAGTLNYNTGTLTYTAGTMNMSALTLANVAVAATFSTNGMTWGPLTLTGAVTVTFNSDMQAGGLVILGGSSSNLTLTGGILSCAAGIRYGGTSGIVSGTTILRASGTGNIDAPGVVTGKISNKINLDASAGTVTINTAFNYDLENLLYTSGTIITGAGTWAAPPAGGSSAGMLFIPNLEAL